MRKNLRKILPVAFIVIGVIFLNNYVLNNFLQNLSYRAVSRQGIFLSETLGRVSKYGASFFNRGAIIRENDELKKENDILLGIPEGKVSECPTHINSQDVNGNPSLSGPTALKAPSILKYPLHRRFPEPARRSLFLGLKRKEYLKQFVETSLLYRY